MKKGMFYLLAAMAACLAGSPAAGDYTLYDDFSWPNTTLNRAKWWRGGLAGVDGTNAILNESDLTTSMMFSEGDFKFVIGGRSASSQGLFGLGDIDDGDPYLVLANSGAGWHFHVRNGSKTYTGPVITSSLAKGDVIVFHWDSTGSSVSINGVIKDSQGDIHPPRMPLTMLEWNNTSTNGQVIMDSVSYSAPAAASSPKPPATTPKAPAQAMVLSAELVEDTFVDSSNPATNYNGSPNQVHVRNCRRHPDLAGAGGIVDTGQLGLIQFALPKLPAGWNVASARLAGVVAQNHNLYGMPGWSPARPIELELLGLSVNPDLTTVTYNTLHDAKGHGVVTDYTASGSVNFTFGGQAQSLEVLQFDTSTTPVGSLLQFPDQQGKLCAFVQSKISQTGPTVITLAIGPGRTQAVSGMECDFKFYAKKNTAGQAPLSLTLELERAKQKSLHPAFPISIYSRMAWKLSVVNPCIIGCTIKVHPGGLYLPRPQKERFRAVPQECIM